MNILLNKKNKESWVGSGINSANSISLKSSIHDYEQIFLSKTNSPRTSYAE